MSGYHADRGDTSHRIVSGQPPVVGLRVIDYDRDPGVIVEVSTKGDCGWYCNAWHTVAKDKGGRTIMNCERLVAG